MIGCLHPCTPAELLRLKKFPLQEGISACLLIFTSFGSPKDDEA